MNLCKLSALSSFEIFISFLKLVLKIDASLNEVLSIQYEQTILLRVTL